MKTCLGCGEEKPLSEYHNRKICRDGKDTRCRTCRREEQQNKVKRIFEEKPGFREGRGGRIRLPDTATMYQRLFEEQGGVCAICGDPPAEGKRLHRDHCHATGRWRQLLCNYCNSMLGFAKDDPNRLAKGIAYLKKHSSERPFA